MGDMIECPICGHTYGGWENVCPNCEGDDLDTWMGRAREAEGRIEKAKAEIEKQLKGTEGDFYLDGTVMGDDILSILDPEG